MTTATKTSKPVKTTRKPALKPDRSAHLSQVGNVQILWITIGDGSQAYRLTQFETDFGIAGFHLCKADKGDGHAEDYDVLIAGNESSCTCPDHTYRRRECKHLSAVACLIRAGKIAVPQRKPAAQHQQPASDPKPEPSAATPAEKFDAKQDYYCPECRQWSGSVFYDNCSI